MDILYIVSWLLEGWHGYGVGFLLIGGTMIVIMVSSLAEEGASIWDKWRDKQVPLGDKKQTPSVRGCVKRLSSSKREVRMEGLQLLAMLNDPTCVPALIRAVDLYPDDMPFLVQTVQIFAQLGDGRALPVLYRLRVGHHYAVMAAAREAIAAIEPKTILLRAAQAPVSSAILLRAAMPSTTCPDPHMLLRPDASSRR